MQILLHSDPHIDGGQRMTEHFATVAKAAMERYGERVSRVEAHLSDVHTQARTSDDNIHCTLEAHLVGHAAVVVKEQAGSAHQAIDGAVRKLQRAVGTEIAKHETRGQR